MRPHEGVGGWTPSPRNDSAASTRMAHGHRETAAVELAREREAADPAAHHYRVNVPGNDPNVGIKTASGAASVTTYISYRYLVA